MLNMNHLYKTRAAGIAAIILLFFVCAIFGCGGGGSSGNSASSSSGGDTSSSSSSGSSSSSSSSGGGTGEITPTPTPTSTSSSSSGSSSSSSGSSSSGSSSYNISGVIEYSPTGNLAGITVTATSTTNDKEKYFAFTDANGNFSVAVPNGTYSVVAKYVGGEEQQIDLGDSIKVDGQSISLGTIKVGGATFNVIWDGGYTPQATEERQKFTAWYGDSGGRVFYDEETIPPVWKVTVFVLLSPGEPKKIVQIDFLSADAKYKGGSRSVEVEQGKNTLFLPEYNYKYNVGQILEKFALDYTPSDICCFDGKLYITSWDLSNKIVVFDINSTTTSFQNLPFSYGSINGIIHNGNSFYISYWNSDGNTSTVKKISANFLTVETTYTSLKLLTGISFDSTGTPWGVERWERKLHKLNPDFSIAESYNLDFRADGICWKNSDVWICGYDVLKKFSSDFSNPTISLTYSGDIIQGICFDDNGFIWLVSYAARKIYKVSGE